MDPEVGSNGRAKRVTLPLSFHVMTKPRGAICNLDCSYCYFLRKERLFPNSNFRMSEQVLEEYTQQYIEGQRVPVVNFTWQGGEPTLMGLDFYRKAIAFQEKYRRPGMRIINSLQTNGVTLDDEWCSFFREHDFLIGVSLDGPEHLHDAYRVDKGGQPTFERVIRGVNLLRSHHVRFNVLTCVHAANAEYPLEVYRFLRDDLLTRYIQFIPVVERDNETGFQEGNAVTERSVTGKQYGAFLIAVFDEWLQRDVGRVSVQIIDVAMATWLGQRPGLCIFEETCGGGLALEHTGDVYSCDHFVEPRYHLGNIADTELGVLAGSEFQRQFGNAKRDALPQYCRNCSVRFICNGGCPKNRFLMTPDGQPGLNYLCAGYKAFFTHIRQPMELISQLIRAGKSRDIPRVWDMLKTEQTLPIVGRNEKCPCGSGVKYKHCHGRPG